MKGLSFNHNNYGPAKAMGNHGKPWETVGFPRVFCRFPMRLPSVLRWLKAIAPCLRPAVLTSPALRCVQTARVLCRALQARLDRRGPSVSFPTNGMQATVVGAIAFAVTYRGIGFFQGLLGGAKWISSIHSRFLPFSETNVFESLC